MRRILLQGSAGRAYEAFSGNKIGRITGLDPTGPLFYGSLSRDVVPKLEKNKLDVSDAAFVDVIHTDGGFFPCIECFKPTFGIIYQIGHRDFYPDGGSDQTECQNAKSG